MTTMTNATAAPDTTPVFKTTRHHTTADAATTPAPEFHSTREAPICASPKCHRTPPLRKDGRGYRKFCHNRCSRVATYHKLTMDERRELNARSNRYRFERRLLPRIKQLCTSVNETDLPPGHPVSVAVAKAILIERYADWSLDHALVFANARQALAKLAGGWEQLDRLEDEVAIEITELMTKKEAS